MAQGLPAANDLLLGGPRVAVYPRLVRALGSMHDAAVLQQILYRLRGPKAWEDEDERPWVSLRYVDLAEETGLSADQARRAVEHLEARGVLLSCQPEAFNRRKAYSIDGAHELFVEDSGGSSPAPRVSPSGRTADRSGTSASSEAAPVPDDPSLLEHEEQGAAGAAAGGEKRKAPRQRNPIFDALADVYPSATKSEQSLIGMVAHELEGLRPVPTPDDVRAVARLALQEWPGSTPRAIPGHWTRLLRQARGQAGPTAARDDRSVGKCRRCGYLTIDCSCEEGPLT